MSTLQTLMKEKAGEGSPLIKMGFAIQIRADIPYVPMTEVVDILLETKNDTYLNDKFGAITAPRNLTAVEVLKLLQEAFPMLPHDRGDTNKFWIVTIGLTILTSIIVGLRFVSRKYITPKKLRLEDWACLVSHISTSLYTISKWIAVIYGYQGFHVWDLTLWQYRNLHIYLRSGEMLFFAAHQAVKTAFLLAYWRLFIGRGYRFAILSVGIFITATTIIGVFGTNFQCAPVDFWNKLSTRKCMNTKIFFITRSSLYTLSDFMILVLPIPGVVRLHIPKKDKLMTIGVFGLGIFVTGVSVKRLYTLWYWRSSVDTFYLINEHTIWAVAELELGIIIMCAASLKVLFFHKNSFMGSIPSVIREHWSRGGTYRAKEDNKPQTNFLNTWLSNKRKNGASPGGRGKLSTNGSMGLSVLSTFPDEVMQKCGGTTEVRATPSEEQLPPHREQSHEDLKMTTRDVEKAWDGAEPARH